MKKEDEIKRELLELNFNVNSIGLVYWLDAIRYMKNHVATWEMIDIYNYIAKKRESTYKNVERAMRYAIFPAKKNIQEKYHYYGRIKPETYLGLIRFKLI